MVTCSLLDKALLQLKFERRGGQLVVLHSSNGSVGLASTSSSEQISELGPTPSDSSHATDGHSNGERAVHWAPILELDDVKCHEPGAVSKPCKPILKADICSNGKLASMHLHLGEESAIIKQSVMQSSLRQLTDIDRQARRAKRSVDSDALYTRKRYCRFALHL